MSMQKRLFLRQDIQAEPLVDRWYAWSHLIPPVTLARNMTERHLRIIESYISAPDLHAKAVQNPKMLGGPFIDYGGQRVDEIAALRDRTLQHEPLLTLSSALVELDTMLQAAATGYSMIPLYEKVPLPLRGYVELVYDLNHHPSYRLFESLLYRSRYYDASLQSLMLSPTTGDDRPFVLSTPRLASATTVHWPMAFKEEAVDQLFGLKTSPAPFAKVRELLASADAPDDLVRALLTPQGPPAYQKYTGPIARWRYFGHACVLVETPTTSILFDPVLSYTYESHTSRYTYNDLPEIIDYVVISHNHQDHILFETLLQIRHQVRHILIPKSSGTLQDPSLKLILQQVGFTNVIELGEMETIGTDEGSITAIPFLGEHGDLDIYCKSGYLVRVGRHSLMFAADSCNVEPALYDVLHREIGDVDALFLGMECNGAPLSWLYGPLFSRQVERGIDQSRRYAGSNYEQARAIVRSLRCREVYVYAMGQEPWLNHVMSLKYTERSKPIVDSNRLIDECRRHGIVAERLFGEKEMFLTPKQGRQSAPVLPERTVERTIGASETVR
jgi:L-ascorbate metabolism protein UlaG (beta-lactamase superfamily)